MSHFGYVHAGTLAVSDWTVPPKVERTGATASYSQRFVGTPLPAHYGIPTGIGCERGVSRNSWGTFHSPALQLAGVDIEDPQPVAGGRREFALRICHATTPV